MHTHKYMYCEFTYIHTYMIIIGILLLLNLTEIEAKWYLVHVPSDVNGMKITLQVPGYNERGPVTDDPGVFEIRYFISMHIYLCILSVDIHTFDITMKMCDMIICNVQHIHIYLHVYMYV
jgi:hypothetical protein